MIVKTLKIKSNYILQFDHSLDIGSVIEIFKKCSNRLKWREYKPRFPERIADANDDCFFAIRKKI